MNTVRSMVLFATGLVGGCVVRAQPAMVVARPAPVVVAEAQPTTVVVTQPQPQTVVVTQPAYPQRVCGQCLQGVQEVCNGCDDNCNGVIDENCRP